LSEQGHELRIASALTEAAKFINVPATLEETLDAITEATLKTVPGFDHAGISIIHRDGSIETSSGSDQLVWELDELQYELREGPCYDALMGAGVVVVEDAQHDERWPRYMAKAVQRGLRAQLAVGLFREQDSVGGLNLYSTKAQAVSADVVHVAELFASQAAIALGRSRYATQLNQALVTRKVIGQAIGILMGRYELTEERAFQFLIRTSSTSNIKLRDVAAELVRTTNDHGARGPESRYDDGVCISSPTQAHQWVLNDVIDHIGADAISECAHCGMPQYEPGSSRGRRSPRSEP
jgi:GAF domain-containing protein